MFCPKCGREIEQSMKFCPGCGYRAMEEKENTISSKPNKTKSKKLTKHLLLLALIAAVVCVVILIAAGNIPKETNTTKTIYVNTKTVCFDANDPDGVPADRWEYEYDELGNLKRSTYYYASYSYSASSGLADLESNVYLTVYSYNDEGIRNGVKVFMNDEIISQGIVACDRQGRIVKVEYQDGAASYTNNYTYDKDGNVLEQWDAADNEITFRQVYAYNENGDLLSSAIYLDGQNLNSTREYQYDSNGKLVGILDVNYYAGGIEESYGEAVYDETGTLSQVIYYDDNHNIEYIYEYDAFGNMVEQSHYYNGELTDRNTNTYAAIEVPIQ